MGGYLTILLVFHILTLSLSDYVIEETDRYSTEKEQEPNLNNRKLPIFPKNNIKFVVTSTPPTNKVYTHKRKDYIMPKMPQISHITMIPNLESFPTTAGRKPLMKLRTFTINPRANGKSNGVHKNSRNVAYDINISNTRAGINTVTHPAHLQTKRKGLYSVIETYTPERSLIKAKSSLNDSDIDDKAQQNKQDQESEKKKDNFISEKEQDRNEFIFLENDDQRLVVNMLDNISQNFDVDTTTELKIPEKVNRVKRSQNIIEEENLASTVSILKYTGDTRLNDNFYFKNINS